MTKVQNNEIMKEKSINWINVIIKRKKTSNPDSYMILILELTDREIKITMTNMLRDFKQKNRQHARTDG